jgi:hypothetical protein
MKLRALLLACLFPAALPAGAASAASAEPAVAARFSQSLANPERTAAGLERLSSDQIAVLDALVRRDLTAQATPRRADAPPPPARFSQRLTADELRNAGLATLTALELTQLDEFVARRISSSLARVLLSPPTFVPLSVRARVAEAKPKTAEIHGSFTLGFGFGSGGYSERFGGMTLTYEDPVRNFAVSFSYSESHIKGAAPYYMRDPLYDPTAFPRYSPVP